jgi:hypothetical protein
MTFTITIFAIVVIPVIVALLWLLSIRPYCRRNGKGFTPGANIGVTLWVDWQEAKEISKAQGDEGMIMICRFVLWLHIIAFAILAYAILSS